MRDGFSVVEAQLLQHLVLGKMPAPKLLLVLVIQDGSVQEALVFQANRAIADGPDAALIDIFVIDLNDKLLPAVRKAQCQLVLQGEATLGWEYARNRFPEWGAGGYRKFIGTTSTFSHDWIFGGWGN